MNGLIVFLAVVGAAMAQYGHAGVQETPEVAAARAAHLQALAAAGGHGPAPAAPSWNSGWNGAPSYGAPAAAGVPADTPEVAAAKAAHFAALSKVGGSQGSYDTGAYNPSSYDNEGQYNPSYNNEGQYNPTPAYSGHSTWQGPQALPPGFDSHGAPLPVQDTPEVQAERAHHLALAARAGAPAPIYPAAAPAPSWNSGYQGAPSWNAPAPAWNSGYQGAPSGAPADTPEVAAAKAAHLAAHQAAGHRYKRSLVAYSAPLAYTAPLLHAPLHYPYLRHSYLY